MNKLKLVVLFAFIAINATVYSQVGIGTTQPNSTLEVNGSIATKVTVVNSDVTLNETHSVVLGNKNNPISITLPSAQSISGRTYVIKNINNGPITISTTSGQTIDGELTRVLNSKYDLLKVVSNGNDWNVIQSELIKPGTSGNVLTSDGNNWVSAPQSGFKHYIGELFGGGIIASLWKEGGVEKGLIVSIEDITPTWVAWSNVVSQAVGSGSRNPNNGQGNTNAIVNQPMHATSVAKLCDQYANDCFNKLDFPTQMGFKIVNNFIF